MMKVKFTRYYKNFSDGSVYLPGAVVEMEDTQAQRMIAKQRAVLVAATADDGGDNTSPDSKPKKAAKKARKKVKE